MVKRGCGLGHAHSGLITVTCLWYELNFSVILFTQECVRNNIRFRWWSKMKSSCYFSSSKRVSKSLLFKITIIKKQCCACLCYKPRPSGQGGVVVGGDRVKDSQTKARHMGQCWNLHTHSSHTHAWRHGNNTRFTAAFWHTTQSRPTVPGHAPSVSDSTSSSFGSSSCGFTSSSVGVGLVPSVDMKSGCEEMLDVQMLLWKQRNSQWGQSACVYL